MSTNRLLAIGGAGAALVAAIVSYLAYTTNDSHDLVRSHFDKGLFGLGYKRDLKTICEAESRSKLSVVKGSAKVTEWITAHVETPAAHALISSMPTELGERSRKLQSLAKEEGVEPCPLAASYLDLLAQGDVRADLAVLCEDGAFPQLPYQDPDERVKALQRWAALHAKSEDVRKEIDSLLTVPDGERGKRLRARADAHNLFRCELVRLVDGPKQPPRPAAVTLVGAPQVTGPGVTPEAIERAVSSMNAELLSCYAQGLKKESTLAGSYTVKFNLGKDQDANRVVPMGGTMKDGAVEECTAAAFRRMRVADKHEPGTSVFLALEFRPPSQ